MMPMPVVLLAAGVLTLADAPAQPAAPKPDHPAGHGCPLCAGKNEPNAQPPEDPVKSDPAYALNFTLKDIDGRDVDLNIYRGRVVLVVNVASDCGYTPQYAGLEKLFQSKKDAGLVILGFPCNDFGEQEPGTEAEIKSFCSSTYRVTFPMFAKVKVKGIGTAPLYEKLAAQPAPIGGSPKWNFTKFLIGREGKVVARFDSRVAPESPELVGAIEKELAKPQPATSASASFAPAPDAQPATPPKE